MQWTLPNIWPFTLLGNAGCTVGPISIVGPTSGRETKDHEAEHRREWSLFYLIRYEFSPRFRLETEARCFKAELFSVPIQFWDQRIKDFAFALTLFPYECCKTREEAEAYLRSVIYPTT